MITNISEALEFYSKRDNEFKRLNIRCIKNRHIPLTKLDYVVKKLGLPNDYAKISQKLQIEGVSLGYFELSPADSGDLCRSLMLLNGETKNIKIPENFIHVAAFDADIIAVSKGEPYHENGTTFFIDISSSSDVIIEPLSKNFEDFIILASALDQAVLEEDKNIENTITEIALTLAPEYYAKIWKLIASMVI